MNASVREIALADKKALRDFITLERKFDGANPLHVSEIDADLFNHLSGGSHFYSDMEHTVFVASSDGRDVARCSALINRRYQKAKSESVGFIGHFAAIPNKAAEVQALFAQAESWLKARGVTRVIAPYNGAALLGVGVLTAAFDEEPMFPNRWNPPHYGEYLIGAGYAPNYPMWFYDVDFTSERYRAAKARASQNNLATIRPINKKRWNDDVEKFRVLLNECFKEEWEFHPMVSDELHEFLDPMKPVLDPNQMLLAEVDGEPAGFCLGMPDWNPLFRSFHGKLGPLQIIKLLFGAGRYSRAGLLGIGVLEQYRGNGISQALATTLYRRYAERGLKRAFYYPVNEVNSASRKFAEAMGGTGRVLYHCYDKVL